jgi:hypothetical protein
VQFVPNHPLLHEHVSGKEQYPFTHVCTHNGVAQVETSEVANVFVCITDDPSFSNLATEYDN